MFTFSQILNPQPEALVLDLSDAFYHLELPYELRRWFTMRRVRASALGITELAGKKLGPGAWLFPRVSGVFGGFRRL